MLTKWLSLFSVLFLLIGTLSYLHAEQQQQKIKVIVFDFGSVIAKTDKQQVIQFIAQSLHISPEEAQDALKQLKQHTLQNKDEQEFWVTYANMKGITLPNNWVEKLNDARSHALKEIPGMIALVKDLQRQGYQTALLSNIRESQAAIKRKLGYYDLFHPAILSYEIGIRKPDPKAYQILLSRLQVPPQVILFIDNQQINVEAAKKLGMDGIVFTHTNQLIQELKQRGIEVSVPQLPSHNALSGVN
jgi:epoxide hydrolase-like predicted phosphatase